MIWDQQDTSEFSHLFVEFIGKGLRGYEGMSVIGTNTIADDTEKSIRPDGCFKNDDPIDNFYHSPKLQNMSGHDFSLLTPRNVSEDMIKVLFTAKFRQEVRKCAEDGSLSTDNGNKTVYMKVEGKNNCINVGGTSSQECILYLFLFRDIGRPIFCLGCVRVGIKFNCGARLYNWPWHTIPL